MLRRLLVAAALIIGTGIIGAGMAWMHASLNIPDAPPEPTAWRQLSITEDATDTVPPATETQWLKVFNLGRWIGAVAACYLRDPRWDEDQTDFYRARFAASEDTSGKDKATIAADKTLFFNVINNGEFFGSYRIADTGGKIMHDAKCRDLSLTAVYLDYHDTDWLELTHD